MSGLGAALEFRLCAEKRYVVVGDQGSDPFEALEAALQASPRAVWPLKALQVEEASMCERAAC